ncbi:hypothetical protein P9112_003040 [Eukaryota sp. TZLM1-RC]
MSTTVKVEPLHCESCASAITDALTSHSSITNVEVDIPEKVVTITHEGSLTIDDISALLPTRTVTLTKTYILQVKVDPLRCQGCAGKVTTALSGHSDIITTDIDIPSKLVTITASKPVTLSGIAELLPERHVTLAETTKKNSDNSLHKEPNPNPNPNPQNDADSNQPNGSTTLLFHLSGLTCVSCSNSVTNALDSLHLPASFTVSLFPSQSLKVDLHEEVEDEGDCISKIINTVKQLGFACTSANAGKSGSKSLKLTITPSLTSSQQDLLASVNGVMKVERPSHYYQVFFEKLHSRALFAEIKTLLPNHTVSTDIAESFSNSSVKSTWFKFYFALFMFAIIFSVSMFGHKVDFLTIKVYQNINISQLIVAISATLLTLSPSGFMFFKKAYKGLFYGKSANMDCLISLAVITAWFYSTISLYLSRDGDSDPELFYETIGALITFVLFGKALETMTLSSTTSSLNTLLNTQAKKAVVIDGEGDDVCQVEVPIALVEEGDLLLVVPGRTIPADGVVVRNTTEVDESVVTGEFKPIVKNPGDVVIGGSTNQSNGQSIVIKVTVVGQDSFLSRVASMITSAQQSKPRLQLIGDRISAWFVPTVVLISLFTFLAWFLLSKFDFIPSNWFSQSPIVYSLMFSLAVLVVSCPCALGLASPTAVMAGSGVAASNGILVKSGDVLEKSAKIDSICLDKTGTLTMGEFSVVHTERQSLLLDEVLMLAEGESDHPIAKGIRNHFKDTFVQSKVSELVNVPGKGIRCLINDQEAYIGSRQFLLENNISVPETFNPQLDRLSSIGCTHVYAGHNGEFLGFVSLADTLRKETKMVIQKLLEMKLNVFLLTGDQREPALHVASMLNISPNNVYSKCLPEDKTTIVAELQEKGHSVLAVGDGLNDSGLLSIANIGLAIGNGTDIAIEAADAVICSNNLVNIVNMIQICKRTVRKIYQNYVWAFIYNITFIPIAAGVFYPWFKVRLDPAYGSLLMVTSSVSVILNTLLLKLYKPWGASRRRNQRKVESLSDENAPLLIQVEDDLV